MGFLNLVIIGIALVGYVNGASIEEAIRENCTTADGYHLLSCAYRMKDFKKPDKDINESDIKEFRRSCNAFENCFEALGHCNFDKDDVNKALTKAKAYCGAINYFVNKFAACAKKISSTTCFDNYDHFLRQKDSKDKKKVEETCKNLFGEDQCLKKEILEHCSKKDWERFRDHLIDLNNDFMKQCDFKNII